MTFMMTSSIDDKSDICQFFLSRLIPYCQHSICKKFHVKWTKIFWDTACFFPAGLLSPPAPALRNQKGLAHVKLTFIETSKIVLIIGTLRICACAKNYWKCVNNKCLRVLMLLCFCIYFRVSLKQNIILETSMMGCDFNVVASYCVQLY